MDIPDNTFLDTIRFGVIFHYYSSIFALLHKVTCFGAVFCHFYPLNYIIFLQKLDNMVRTTPIFYFSLTCNITM